MAEEQGNIKDQRFTDSGQAPGPSGNTNYSAVVQTSEVGGKRYIDKAWRERSPE